MMGRDDGDAIVSCGLQQGQGRQLGGHGGHGREAHFQKALGRQLGALVPRGCGKLGALQAPGDRRTGSEDQVSHVWTLQSPTATSTSLTIFGWSISPEWKGMTTR